MKNKLAIKGALKICVKIGVTAVFFLAVYIAIGLFNTQVKRVWNEYVSADITFANGETAHYDSNVFTALNKGDRAVVQIEFPESKKGDSESSLCFCVYNCVVRAYCGNQQVYTFGQEIDERGDMIGGVYAIVPIPEEAWGSTLTIELNVTEDNAISKVRSFDLYPSTVAYRSFLKNNILNFLISITGIICSVFTLFIFLAFWKGSNRLSGICIILFSLFASIWIFTNSGLHRMFSDAYFWVPMEYIALYSMPIPLLGYLAQTSNSKLSRRRYWFVVLLNAIFVFAMSALHFTGTVHFCKTLTFAHVVLLADIIIMLVTAFFRLRRNTASTKYFLGGIFTIMVVGLFDVLRFNIIRYIPLFVGNTTPSVLAVGLVGFIAMLVAAFNSDAKAERERAIVQEQEVKRLLVELENSRIKVMINQMQPHFLYNALSAIRAITKTNPNYAYDLLYDFTVHLRSNIKAFSSDAPIPFTDELANVEAYLNIERMRFGDKLVIEYDIQCDDFSIIPLSIQPIAENAVRHGLYPKGESGGTVKIRTRESEACYLIEIEDDGVGFDVESTLSGKPDSVGLRSLIFRLRNLMNANVEIDSKLNQGTKITVLIPKKQ